MGLELRLAWRNVWRNPRRTVLTIAATVFAVFLVVFFVGMAAGSHAKWIEDTVRVHSGHLAVTADGYLDHRTLDYNLHWSEPLREDIEATPDIVGMAPRVTAFALLSKTSKAHGAMVLGVDPAREGSVSTLPQRVRRGRFLGPDTPGGIVLGERLARTLGADLGDEVLVYSVAWSLEMAYELFTVTGVVSLPEPELERRFAAIRLDDAQRFFVFGDRVTEVALLADDSDRLPSIAAALRAHLADQPDATVHTWDELMPQLEQMILLDDASLYIMLLVLIVVVAFGILNTILMSVLERAREWGVLLALGLRPGAIFRLVVAESTMLAAVGLVIGLALAVPAVLWFQGHPVHFQSPEMKAATEMFGFEPIMCWKFKPTNPLGSGVTILGVALLAALQPAWKASRARPVDALRGV